MVRFSNILGQRIAWAADGDGPLLVFPSPWLSNVDRDLSVPEFRRFIELLSAEHTVVRYDRPGTGMSDRDLPSDPGLDRDVLILEGLVEEIGAESVALLGVSSGGAVAIGFAARNPGATSALVFAGSYLDGSKLASRDVRDSLVSMIRANWGLGTRMLSDIFLPGASDSEREAFTEQLRGSADPETAADLYELVYSYDASRAARHVSAPALVLHRRDDAAVDFELGRELAASLANSRFQPLEGDRHLPWYGDTDAVVSEVLAFLREHPSTPPPSTGSAGSDAPGSVSRPGLTGPLHEPDLSPRELEVLRLVAEGLSDREIAGKLVLSPHTVHRHVANIRFKLGQPSRAAAAAQAARLGLI